MSLINWIKSKLTSSILNPTSVKSLIGNPISAIVTISARLNEVDTEMQRYKMLLLDSIEKNDGKIIPTLNLAQSHLMTTHMMNKVENSMNTIVGVASKKIFEDISIGNSFLKLLEKGIHINAIFLKAPAPESRMYELLRKYNNSYNKTFHVKVITDSSSQVLSSLMEDESEGDLSSFTTFDDNIFRLEMSAKNFKAIGSFNNKEYTEQLNDVFSSVFKKSMSLFPSPKF